MARVIKQQLSLQDFDLMPSGKHKGLKMEDVPAKYLLYIYENEMCSPKIKEYIESNLDIIKMQAKNE